MGIRIYSNSFSNPEYYSYSYSLKVDSTNNIRIRIRVKIIIRDNTDLYSAIKKTKMQSCNLKYVSLSLGEFKILKLKLPRVFE